MLFTPYEIVVILRTVLSPAEIRAKGGPVEEVQRRILKNSAYKVMNMEPLMRLLFEYAPLPWDAIWRDPIEDLYKLHADDQVVAIERKYAAFYRMARTIIDANIASVDSRTRHAALFFAGLFKLAFVKPKHAMYANIRADALESSCRDFQTLINELKDNGDLSAIVIKGKAAANIVVARWNGTSPGKRNNKEMRRFIRGSGYIRWAI